MVVGISSYGYNGMMVIMVVVNMIIMAVTNYHDKLNSSLDHPVVSTRLGDHPASRLRSPLAKMVTVKDRCLHIALAAARRGCYQVDQCWRVG